MLKTLSAAFAFEPLPFETAEFGRPVSRLKFNEEPSGAELARQLAAEIGERKRTGEFMVSCRIAEPVAEAFDQALRGAAFTPVETLITFECAIEAPLESVPASVAAARPEDVEPCVAIGASAFVYDRFHADLRLPKDRADALKGAWVRNDLIARADASFVARREGEVAGFVLCLKQGEVAIIDLIAVGAGHQRRGLGRALMLAAIAHYAGPGRRMRVGTQETNRASIELYRALGFAPVARARTYHWVAA